MKKIKVMDTNVFLSDPKSLFAFPGELIVIPISVIEEIDEFKKGLNELGRNARYVLRKIDKLRKRGSLTGDGGRKKLPGIELNNKGRLVIELNHTDQIPAGLNPDKVDNRILAVALYYKKEFPKSEVALITKDANVRIKADALGVMALDYETAETSNADTLYQGYKVVKISNDQFEEFSDRGEIQLSLELNPNEYVIMENKEKDLTEAGRFDSKLNKVVKLHQVGEVFGLKALNIEQRFALDMLLNPEIPLVTLTGKAGTGKTLLAVAAGLHQADTEGKYLRLLVSRPVFPLGKDIGYLPGTVEEKLNPWMQPIFDNLEFLFSLSSGGKHRRSKTNHYEELKNQGLLEVEPLTYIRGRSIPQQFMVIDEAQNLTLHEIKTIVTRAGKNTKIVFTGDPEQIDNPYVDSQSNGLSQLIEKMKSQVLSAHVHLNKGERSELAEMASQELN